jgi:hypothetical protein
LLSSFFRPSLCTNPLILLSFVHSSPLSLQSKMCTACFNFTFLIRIRSRIQAVINI